MSKEEYKEYPCDLCESNDAIEVPHAREYTNNEPIYICKKCGFVYVKKRRDPKVVASVWSDEIYGEGYTAKNPHVKARQTYIAEFIDTHLGLKGKKLCDIGGGEGQFLEIAKSYGAKVFGVEPSKKNCEMLKKMGIENFNGTIEEFFEQIGDYKADIVTIMWTLENTTSCLNMLNAAHKILNDDGHILVATGSRILVPFKKPIHLYLSKNPADTHCFRFSANTLKGILAKTGFEVIHINPYIDNDILCVLAKKRTDGKKTPWEGDDYLKVEDFFERWHKESLYYR